MTCLALLSIEPGTSLRPIATVYDASEAAVAGQDHRVKLRAGRLVALLTLTGEAEEIAGRMYDSRTRGVSRWRPRNTGAHSLRRGIGSMST